MRAEGLVYVLWIELMDIAALPAEDQDDHQRWLALLFLNTVTTHGKATATKQKAGKGDTSTLRTI